METQWDVFKPCLKPFLIALLGFVAGNYNRHNHSLLGLLNLVFDLMVIVGVIWFLFEFFNGIRNLNRKAQEIRDNEKELRLKKIQEANERKIKEEEIKKEIEIERRTAIVNDIIENLYAETETEVNKTQMPTLSNELNRFHIALYSDNLNLVIVNGSLTDFENIVNSIKSELERIMRLAIGAQANGKMTKEKAFEILGVKNNSTKEENKKAYWNLAKKYNTDQRTQYEVHVKQMLEEKMKELNSAKEYLSTLGLI